MRLLHTTEKRSEEFYDDNVPVYAIISHCWGNDEITFQDFQYLRLDSSQTSMIPPPILVTLQPKMHSNGYTKVLKSCELAASDGYQWLWIDTVCIDKTSSSELSEAINSMYRWYGKADVCYAYLQDVPASLENDALLKAIGQSLWWSRGWTLQELLAPSHLIFIDAQWQQIGDKKSFRYFISGITDIEPQCLEDALYISTQPVATRMSWVTRRATSRSEDIAYCLLGIFDVNMPLLYGEGGGKAFRRLCEEIIKISDDDSIFQHTGPFLLPNGPWDYALFAYGINIEPWNAISKNVPLQTGSSTPDMKTDAYFITNKGLLMPSTNFLEIDPSEQYPDLTTIRFIPLQCAFISTRIYLAVGLYKTTRGNLWVRIQLSKIQSLFEMAVAGSEPPLDGTVRKGRGSMYIHTAGKIGLTALAEWKLLSAVDIESTRKARPNLTHNLSPTELGF